MINNVQSTVGRYRWTICVMMFFATTINYMDRQILGLLAPMLQNEIHWTQTQYAHTVMVFTVAYAIGLAVFGRIADRVGERVLYGGAMALWSVAAILHAVASTVPGFTAVRGLLGFAEASNFPVAIRTTALWFPKKERALATGLWNMGATVGGIVAPALIPFIAVTWGWRAAFVFGGALGFLWFAIWQFIYRTPSVNSALSRQELEYINSDTVDPSDEGRKESEGWLSMLRYRETWAFIIGKFMTDPIWWFYLFWLPKYMNEANGIDLSHMGTPLVTIYVMACIGSVLAGWVSSRLMAKTDQPNLARKVVMSICAVCVMPIALVSQIHALWFSVLAIGLAAAAHQGWSANLVTMVSDVFPKRAVGTVIGMGGLMGMAGSFLFSGVIGETLERTGKYWALFAVGAFAYIIALGIIHLLMPKMKPVKLTDSQA